jgi:hypothetical protein
MPDAERNDLVQIHMTILEPHERADNLPPSTAAAPYECWIKGFLIDKAANVGDTVTIQTLIGREFSGTLYRVNPIYDHNFGTPQKELLPIGNEARHQLGQR